MFIPNLKCQIRSRTQRNVYGEELLGASRDEGCAVLGLTTSSKLTNSNQQLSGSGSRAADLEISMRLMLTSFSTIELDDQVTCGGRTVRVTSMEPQYSTAGRLDHFIMGGTPWA
jgi:hypothetical protein